MVVGLVAGWLIGKWTEYSTASEFKPTRDLADQAVTGPATIIIGGVAAGMKSTWMPVLIIGLGTILSFGFACGFSRFEDLQYFGVGLYGVGIAAVGMLATLGITLATDAYGPIADNAGGNAQMAGLDPIVRERTDALDALGNTTAATGKGFAIGSAALTALALLAAYIEEVRVGFDHWGKAAVTESWDKGFYKVADRFVVEQMDGTVYKPGDDIKNRRLWLVLPSSVSDNRVAPAWDKIETGKGPAKRLPEAEMLDVGKFFNEKTKIEDPVVEFRANHARMIELKRATLPDFTNYYDASLMNPKVLVGLLIGAMSTFLFSALTMQSVGRAAKGMVEEVRRQFREKPGIMKNTELPDYAAPVAISTKAAQREMILPSLLGLITPVLTGVVLGVGGVLGLLVGALSSGFCLAVFMANSGGAWDNAKKFIEGGAHGGKGTEAHKAAVVGDTVGDPFKDTSGPSLNILIKLMSMVSVVAAGLVVRYSLQSMGWF